MAYRNGLLAGLLEAELLGRKSTYAPTSFTQAFTCQAKHAGVIRVDPDGDPCPPYSITYNKVANGCRFLTVGDEEGCVSIVDTNADTLPSSLYIDQEQPPRAKWLAHNNTIFDMAWAKHDSLLYTASGDQHVGVWDTAVGRLRVYCAGHDGSVKAVCPHSTQPDVFASGSRDGGILLWDLRMPSQWHAGKNRMQLGPVKRIDTATSPGQQYGQLQQQHTPGSAGKQQPRTGSCRGTPARASATNGRRSVTSLLFVRSEHTMISSSDMDGIVKLWDLRKLTTPTGDITLPAGSSSPAPGSAQRRGSGGRGRAAGGKRAADDDVCWLGFTCLSRSMRPAGITSMALSPAGDMLLVSTIDSSHYLYSLAALDQPPVATFTGHRVDSFCIKSCFSPCGRHILSGSSDKRAYIWDVSQPSLPPVSLSGHAGEVTAVAWCPADHCQIATAADDATLRVWTLDRNNTKYQQTYEHCNYLFAAAGQQQGLWGRLGGGQSTKAAAAATAAKVAAVQEESSSQTPAQRLQVALAAAAKAVPTTLPPPAAAAPSGSAATAGGMAVAGKASICSPPVTPQLPFWRKDDLQAMGSTPGGAVASAPPPAAGTAAGAGVWGTPASQQPRKVHPGSAKATNTTPRLRQLLLSDQLSSARLPETKHAAAAPASSPAETAAAGTKQIAGSEQWQQAAKGSPPHKQSQQQQSQQQQQQRTTRCDALLPGQQPDAAAPDKPAAAQQGKVPAAAAAAAVFDGAGSPTGGVQAFEDWMKALTPSQPDEPSSSQRGNSQQQQQPPCGFSGGLFGSSLQHREHPSTCRRGGVVELSTPWALPTPLRQQRLAEQAALEAEHVQQSHRLQCLSLQDRQQQQQQACDWDHDVPRQLHDEFEVFCDDDSGHVIGVAAAADSAGTPVSSACQENLFKAEVQAVAAAAAAGAAKAEGCVVSADACMHAERPQYDIDIVSSGSVPVDVVPGTQLNDMVPTQQDLQQLAVQGQTVKAVRSPTKWQQQPQLQQLPESGLAPKLQAAGQKPGEYLLAGVGRTPFGDLSTLLPGADEGAPSPGGRNPAAAAASAALAGRGRELAGERAARNSPVRVLHMSAGGAAGSAAAAQAAGEAADSPLLMMLQHARLTSQQQQQQGVAGLVVRPPQQQQQQLSPVRHSPAHTGEGHKRLSRLGDRQMTPSTFAVHQPQQHQQQRCGAAAAVGASKDVDNVHAGVLAMMHSRGAAQMPTLEGQQSNLQQPQQLSGQPPAGTNQSARQVAPHSPRSPAKRLELPIQVESEFHRPVETLVAQWKNEGWQDLCPEAEVIVQQQQQKLMHNAAQGEGEASEPLSSSGEGIGFTGGTAARHMHQRADVPTEGAEAALQAGRAPAAGIVRPGGIKRSAVPHPSDRKRQCTLADLWTVKVPEVEDGQSRFSAF